MQIYEYMFFKLSKIEGGGGDTSPRPPRIAAYAVYT